MLCIELGRDASISLHPQIVTTSFDCSPSISSSTCNAYVSHIKALHSMCLFPIFLVMCTTFKSCRPISLHTWTNDFIFLLNTRGLYIQRKNQRPTHLTSRYIHVLTNEAWNVFLAKIPWGYLTVIVEAKNVAREADYSRRVCRIWDSYFHRQRKLCRDDKKKPHWIYPTSVQLFYTIFNS